MITTIVLGVLALQGTITPMEWGYGMIALSGAHLIAGVHSFFAPRTGEDPDKKQMRLMSTISSLCLHVILQGTLLALVMTGVIPVAPVAITLIALNAYYGGYYSSSCMPVLKGMADSEAQA